MIGFSVILYIAGFLATGVSFKMAKISRLRGFLCSLFWPIWWPIALLLYIFVMREG